MSNRVYPRRPRVEAADRLDYRRIPRPVAGAAAHGETHRHRLNRGGAWQHAQSRETGRAGASGEGVGKEPESRGHSARPNVMSWPKSSLPTRATIVSATPTTIARIKHGKRSRKRRIDITFNDQDQPPPPRLNLNTEINLKDRQDRDNRA